MRFVWAVVAFVLAAILIGAGIAQRTVFLGPKTAEAEVSVEQPLPYTVIDGAVLTSNPGAQTVLAQADGTVFASYGRTTDLQAWLSDTSYNLVTVGDAGAIETVVVDPVETEDPAAEESDAAADEAADAPGRNPAGSDLWLDEFSQEDRLIAQLNLPESMSVLIATDGTEPAPATVNLSWPISNSTPWAGPLITFGAILMGIGVFLYILGIRHVRRSRGPRRKGLPPLPATQPLDTLPEAAAKGVITSGTAPTIASSAPARTASARRAFAIVPAVAISALLFSGCSAEAWPQFGPSATPTPTPSVLDAEDAQSPAVTERQAERILADIAQTVSEADEAADAKLAATRLSDAVLDERKANYLIRSKVDDYAALSAIPTTAMGFTLPQAYDGWPRTVMMVVGDEAPTGDGAQTDASPSPDASAEPVEAPESPTIILMTQADPWADYKISYLANLAAATTLPDVAGATVGASQVPPDSTFLLLPPDQVASAYADVITNGDDSEFAPLFQEEGDQFRTKVAEDRSSRLEQFNATAAETGSLTFSSEAGAYDPFALATLESGAIVAVTLTETDTVKPTNEDAVIKLENNPTVQALAGTENSATGFTTNYSDQLFFYVPNQASGGQIQLLGFASNILSAGVIE